MYYSIVLMIVVMHILSAPARGQIYMYIGKDGVVRYVDKIDKVPEENRPKVKEYKDLIPVETQRDETKESAPVKQPSERSNETNQSEQVKAEEVKQVFSAPTSGGFYKYIDKDGVVRYVDKIDKVPEENRPEATKYENRKGF